MSKTKTNAIRMLDTKKIFYKVYTYEPRGGKIDGVSVAENLGKDPHLPGGLTPSPLMCEKFSP
ncbi:MAG: hypothetical protein IMW92_06360 [Bacillales bacterium]|nr:hypothetical protein [Bacillales bacterium]